jgi:3-O-methylgallate 3,4-dioxygenase
MAKIVLGLGTSHSPMLSLPAEHWHVMGENDKRNQELCDPADGKVRTYEEMLERADPDLVKGITQEKFNQQYEETQEAIAVMDKTLKEVAPDAVIIISDDQDEILFEDNMPMFSVYWGESMPILARKPRPDAPPWMAASGSGYAGDTDQQVPVDSELGYHLITSLAEQEFDIAHSRYMKDSYGGTVERRYPVANGQRQNIRNTDHRAQGMPHGFSFVIRRIMTNKVIPIVPLMQNTCYPPNRPTPRRSYALGQAVRRAVESWDNDKRVAVVASGGLSHFTVNEQLDRMALKGMKEQDAETLRNIPQYMLNSAASETLNWVAAAGALEHLNPEILAYTPVYRSPALTGGGWAFMRWTE